MSLRKKLYSAMIEQYPLIQKRYRMVVNQGASRPEKYLTLTALHLRRLTGTLDYRPASCINESAQAGHIPPNELVDQLGGYEVLSFDIFDTLLLRPFSHPAELFHLVGERLGYLNFAELRERMEQEARRESLMQHGTDEVSLLEIYQSIQTQCGIPAEIGMEVELEIERKLLYGNPYFLDVFRRIPAGKQVIAVSDTYFPPVFLREMLDRCGFRRINKIFASSFYRKGKGSGGLFQEVLKQYGQSRTYMHIGDNPRSDHQVPGALGLQTFLYPNVHHLGNRYRTTEQSAVVGGAWRGIVNARFHNGKEKYTPYFEYGYCVGGIFVLGYCRYIHRHVSSHSIGRVLFLSRDGDILKQVYDRLYPQADTRYVHWSRAAAAKLGAGYFQYDYFRRFVHHKTGRQTVAQVLQAMELGMLEGEVLQDSGLKMNSVMDRQAAQKLEHAVRLNWPQLLEVYSPQRQGAKQYLEEALQGCEHACTVDIGWAGSGGVILSHMVREWGIPCEVTGIVAGTNSAFSEELDAAEPLLASGRMSSYLFSQSMNRSWWKSHNPGASHNLWMEMLLASPQPGFLGYSLTEEGEPLLNFDQQPVKCRTQIEEIQKGVLRFVEDYTSRFQDFPYLWDISGSDAYAPFATAVASKGYFRKLTEDFQFEQGVAEEAVVPARQRFSKRTSSF